MPLFLADESCDFAVVRALRSAEYNVTAICEVEAVKELGDRLTGLFVVLTPRRIKIGRDPWS